MSSLFPYSATTIRDNVPCYHPDVAGAQDDFRSEAFDGLVQVEDGHFWFETRNAILRHFITKYLPQGQEAHRFLEIGCGTGFVLRMIAQLPGVLAAGAEVHVEGARLAAPRVPSAEVVQLDVLRMDFPETFHAIGVFDVLEHLEDDVAALTRIREALKRGGLCFITVPQHQWLWSPQDDISGHKRRYTREQLTSRLNHSGFEPVFVTSFFSSVLPFLMASRAQKKIMQSLGRADPWAERLSEILLPDWLNHILRSLSAVDVALIKKGFNLPCGGSLFAVAARRE